jgi:hypothetical protein
MSLSRQCDQGALVDYFNGRNVGGTGHAENELPPDQKRRQVARTV